MTRKLPTRVKGRDLEHALQRSGLLLAAHIHDAQTGDDWQAMVERTFHTLDHLAETPHPLGDAETTACPEPPRLGRWRRT